MMSLGQLRDRGRSRLTALFPRARARPRRHAVAARSGSPPLPPRAIDVGCAVLPASRARHVAPSRITGAAITLSSAAQSGLRPRGRGASPPPLLLSGILPASYSHPPARLILRFHALVPRSGGRRVLRSTGPSRRSRHGPQLAPGPPPPLAPRQSPRPRPVLHQLCGITPARRESAPAAPTTS